MAETSKSSGSWTDAFPAPRTTAPILTREAARSDLSAPELLIVDVRRTDYEGGTIVGSINLPAHSFYMNRGVLYDLCKRAGVKRVAFYCGKYITVSVRCRTTMAAPWCEDRVRAAHHALKLTEATLAIVAGLCHQWADKHKELPTAEAPDVQDGLQITSSRKEMTRSSP